MNIRTVITFGLKLVILIIVLTFCFIIGAILSGLTTPPGNQASNSSQAHVNAQPAPAATQVSNPNPGAVLLPLLLVCFLETVVLAYIILRARGWGWELVGAVFLAFYGLNTVVAQIDTILYLNLRLPHGMIPKLFAQGAIMAAIFSPLAVLILGKWKGPGIDRAPDRLGMSPGEWAIKFLIIAAAYLVLYYGFGYFVAWKNLEVRKYYGGTDPGSFLGTIAMTWRTRPWMFPVQALRGILWALFALPLIHLLKGPRWETGLATSLLFAVWSSQLLLPNPFMPEAVARTHLVETLLSNFIFGWLVGWLLHRHRALYVKN